MARLGRSSNELLYRGFLTEGIKVLTKNTANAAGGEVMNLNFIEFTNGKTEKVEDDRTSDEIIEDISSRLDALGGNNERI